MAGSFATPCTVAREAPLSMGFSRQEYWSGWLFPSPGDLPNSGSKARYPAWWADSLPSEPQYVKEDLLEELAQAVIGAKKSHSLPSVSWRTKKANGIIQYRVPTGDRRRPD